MSNHGTPNIEERLTAQRGKCAICLVGMALVIDNEHRGDILCLDCYDAVRAIKHSLCLARWMAEYLAPEVDEPEVELMREAERKGQLKLPLDWHD